MSAFRRSALPIGLLLAATACGGGSSSGGTDPEPTVNTAPEIQVSAALTGSGSSWRFTSPVASSDTLTFTATDAEDDPLQWQLAAIGDPATVGVTIPLPITGPTFTLVVAPVTLPASCDFLLYVEDTHGAAAAIDLQIVRTGPPTITGIAPASAFRTHPQTVTITGDSLLLGGTVSTSAHFGGLLASGIHVTGETRLDCTTPTSLPAGPIVVGVSNLHGSDSLPDTAFTAYDFPPQFPTSDTAFDAGAGSALATADDGETLHATWLEGGAVIHRTSSDGGESWSLPQTLSGGETPTEPQVAIDGDHVTVAWIGDGTAVLARSSTDGGATFAAATTLNPLAGAVPAARPRLGVGGNRVYAAWIAGTAGLGAARLVVSVSGDAGATWTAPLAVDDGSANQAEHSLVCDGVSACLAFLDYRQGASVAGTYTSRSDDGGQTWTPAALRSYLNETTASPRLCADGADLHLVWLRGAALEYVRAINHGLSWSTQITQLNDTTGHAASAPAIACIGTSVFAAYVQDGTSVWVSRITAPGALPEPALVSTASVNVGGPRVHAQGNYVFVAWRSDDVGTGLARILLAVSTDLGQGYSAPSGYGDGTAAQELPHLLVDGARTTLLWLDHRGTTPALFLTRN